MARKATSFSECVKYRDLVLGPSWNPGGRVKLASLLYLKLMWPKNFWLFLHTIYASNRILSSKRSVFCFLAGYLRDIFRIAFKVDVKSVHLNDVWLLELQELLNNVWLQDLMYLTNFRHNSANWTLWVQNDFYRLTRNPWPRTEGEGKLNKIITETWKSLFISFSNSDWIFLIFLIWWLVQPWGFRGFFWARV